VDVQRTQVEVERHPPIEVKEPQVLVDEHQRGQASSWFGPANPGPQKPLRPRNVIKRQRANGVPSTSASRQPAIQYTISRTDRSRSRKRTSRIGVRRTATHGRFHKRGTRRDWRAESGLAAGG
jgi:hypothetical protein